MDVKKNKWKLLVAFFTIAVITCVLVFYSMASGVEYISYNDSYISPADIQVTGDAAYVADATQGMVYKTSIGQGNVTSRWNAAGKPVNGVLADGGDVFVLSGELDGTITKLDAELATVSAQGETGHTPVDVLAKGGKLYVANRFSSTVTVHNRSDLSVTETIDVGREPVAMTAADDKIYVAMLLPEGPADEDVVAANVAVIDTANNNQVSKIPLPNGTSGVRGICASEDGKYVYVSHILARYTYPITQIDRGWVNTNAITIIEIGTQEVLTSVLLDEVDLGSPNPWGVAVNGDQLVVTISGSHEVIIIDTPALFSQIGQVKAGTYKNVATVGDIPNYLPFLDNVKTRITLNGEGARAVAVSGSKAYICLYFSGNIEVVDLSAKQTMKTISLGEQPDANVARFGEALFFDATLCYQNWESCASCHTDARVDGLNWDSLNDGMGNPKQTVSLIYSHRTPPVLLTGAHESAEIAVYESIDLATAGQDINDAINEYLKSLTPVQSPYLERDGSLSKSAENGKRLFESTGCVKCHPAPFYTDLSLHKSSILDEADGWEDRDFATPTLIEIWRTGPYFFNGTFKTLKEAVNASLPDNHGLSDREIDDLTNFVGSIGNQGEYYGVEQVRSTSANGEEKINALQAGSIIQTITIKKQLDTDKKAKILFTLYDKNGNVLSGAEMSTALNAMETGDTAIIRTEIGIPRSLEKGSYGVISIFYAGDSSVKLASDYKITY